MLIEPGQTPTGFGLALVRELDATGVQWSMRPLSPCCGAFMDPSNEYNCEGCTYSFQAFASDCAGTIGNFVPIHPEGTSVNGTFSRWIARIMGYPNAESIHDVEVNITWT